MGKVPYWKSRGKADQQLLPSTHYTPQQSSTYRHRTPYQSRSNTHYHAPQESRSSTYEHHTPQQSRSSTYEHHTPQESRSSTYEHHTPQESRSITYEHHTLKQSWTRTQHTTYNNSREPAPNSHSRMASTTRKHQNFVCDPMGRKLVTEVPGVGPLTGRRLSNIGCTQATGLLGEYLTREGEESSFVEFMQDKTDALPENAKATYDALKEWSDNNVM